MARAASLLVVCAALCLCHQTHAFWLPSWASWYKKPEVATAYSLGTYPAPVESAPAPAQTQQFSGHGLYGGAQAVPVAVPYPVPVAAGPHLQMPPGAGQLSLSSYSVGVSSGGGNSVASDAGGGVGVSVGGMQLVPCWCSVARVESEDSSGGLGSGPGAGGSFTVQAAQPVGN